MSLRDLGYQWRCHIGYSGFTDSLKFYVARDTYRPGEPCRVQIWKLTDFSEHNEGDYTDPEPTISGPRQCVVPFIQAIVDAAWAHGIEPSALKLKEAENRTQRQHLNDMRAIVSKELGVKFPLD